MDTAMERAQAILADEPEEQAQKERLAQVEETGRKIIEVLRTVYDPEIPVNIYELGLIYKIDVEDDDRVLVEMTLTSPQLPGGRDPARRGRAEGGRGRRRRPAARSRSSGTRPGTPR